MTARAGDDGSPYALGELRRAGAAIDHDPVASAIEVAALDGLSALRAMIAGELPPPPIAHLLGFELIEVEDGRAVFAAAPGERHSRGLAPLRPAA